MTSDGLMTEQECLVYAETMLLAAHNRTDQDYVIVQKQVLRVLLERATRPHD